MTENHAVTFLKPAKNDVLGDRWSSQIRDLYDKSLEKLGISKVGDGMGAVWNLFQWQYCKMAEMECRIISSPEAMAMCGWKLTDEMLNLTHKLILTSSDILEERSTA